MKKFIIISFCFFAAVLHAMEQQSNELFIDFAQEKHIPALTALSNEVLDDFFKPTMIREYSDYPPEAIQEFFDTADIIFEELFKKATSTIENNKDRILIASTNKESDNLLGLCAFKKQGSLLFIDYLIVSQQLRGKGIGKTLLAKALSTYNDVKLCQLVTFARGNEATQAFYEKLGFTSTKELCGGLPCMPNTHFLYELAIKK